MQSDTNFSNDVPGSDTGTGGAAGGQGSDNLEAQVAKLREDVAGVADALKGLASNHADNAKRQAFALGEDIRGQGERYLRQAQDAASDLEAEMSERIRAEPVKAVLIAAAVGYLYARIFH